MGALNDCGGVEKSNYAKGEEFREFRGGMSTLWLSYLFTVGVVLQHLGCRVNSSGSQKAADSNVSLRMNISAPVRSSNSAKISKNVASLVD